MRLKLDRIAIALITAVLVLGTVTLVAAQDEGESDMTSLTGCLAETDDGSYVLEEEGSGEEIALEGEGLSDHVGHTVSLTGEWAEDEDGTQYFVVDSLEHIASSCEG